MPMIHARLPLPLPPILCLTGLLALIPLVGGAATEAAIETEKQRLSYRIVTEGLHHPWSLAFLPDGRMLVSERRGDLRLIEQDGRLHPQPIGGLPEIRQHGQGGLLDLALHPQFADNRLVYFSFTEPGAGGVGTAVARGRLADHRLHEVDVIFRLQPKSGGRQHFGSRLVFDRTGYLYVTLGDRGERPRAQRLDDHAGSLIRLHDDGGVPEDNPFVDRTDAKPEIYSYGHRNLQGAALHPETGRIWVHEHGPQGGDELNLPRPGVNYGWPVITYGTNYVIGTQIGEGTHKPGMAQPIHYWVPSIAPSGMVFVTSERFPAWQGDLLIGSLKFRQLVRLELEGERVVHEERLLSDRFGRIRDVRQGPDGYLYLLTDERDGRLIRLMPAAEASDSG